MSNVPQSGNLFGNSNNTITSNVPQSMSMFGSNSGNALQSGGLFGSNSGNTYTSNALQSGGFFGAQMQQQQSNTVPVNYQQSNQVSYQQPQQQGGFSFGNANRNNNSLFGSSQSNTTSNSLFGAPQPQRSQLQSFRTGNN